MAQTGKRVIRDDYCLIMCWLLIVAHKQRKGERNGEKGGSWCHSAAVFPENEKSFVKEKCCENIMDYDVIMIEEEKKCGFPCVRVIRRSHKWRRSIRYIGGCK